MAFMVAWRSSRSLSFQQIPRVHTFLVSFSSHSIIPVRGDDLRAIKTCEVTRLLMDKLRDKVGNESYSCVRGRVLWVQIERWTGVLG